MNITSVTIAKFRSIKNSHFYLNNITAVVGENNAGKTAVLRAINAVLNYKKEEPFFINKSHQYAARNNTYITINFSNIPDKDVYSDKVCNDTLTIQFSYSYSDNKKKFVLIKGTERINVDDDFIKLLSDDITYIYIPAGRTNSDISWNENSIFKELINNYALKYVENRDMISGYVRKAADKIHDSILKKLELQINDLYLQDKDVDFKVDFPNDLDFTSLLSFIQVYLEELGSNFALREWGSGTKSLAIIAMHRANALITNKNIVLGLEEPEMNLHPQAQKRFVYSLKKSMHANETQTIFTTHSTVLINELAHEDIILVRRMPLSEKNRKFHSVINQLPLDFWRKYNLEEFKHYQYFKYRNSDFFFSKYVIVGESKNDCQVFRKLISGDVDEKLADISFLNAEGVESLKYPYCLLKELKIPFVLCVDKDYFFEYENSNTLDLSRDGNTGLPKYDTKMKDNFVLKQIFDNDDKIKGLEEANKKGYRKFFEYIKNYNILSMNYCLEMDLSCSSKAREEYYKHLNVMPNNQSQSFLLTKNSKAIKKIELILSILEDIPVINYPESYLKIKNAIIEDINKNTL